MYTIQIQYINFSYEEPLFIFVDGIKVPSCNSLLKLEKGMHSFVLFEKRRFMLPYWFIFPFVFFLISLFDEFHSYFNSKKLEYLYCKFSLNLSSNIKLICDLNCDNPTQSIIVSSDESVELLDYIQKVGVERKFKYKIYLIYFWPIIIFCLAFIAIFSLIFINTICTWDISIMVIDGVTSGSIIILGLLLIIKVVKTIFFKIIRKIQFFDC